MADKNFLKIASIVVGQLLKPYVLMFSNEITELGMLFRESPSVRKPELTGSWYTKCTAVQF